MSRTRYVQVPKTGATGYWTEPMPSSRFPLAAPSAQAIARESDTVGEWMRAWRTWSQVHPAARLRTVTRRTVVGAQEVFTHLDFQTVDDLVVLDEGLADHWRQANARWCRMCALPDGVVQERLRPLIPQIVDLEEADLRSCSRPLDGSPRTRVPD